MDFEENGAGAGGSADFMGDQGGAAGGTGDQGGAAGGEGGAGGDAGAGGEAGAGGDQGGVDPEWFGNVSAETLEGEKASNRDWLKSAGVKDLDGLVKVARDNQNALRESGRVKIPGEGASESDIKAFHKAIGVPDDPKGYEVSVPKGEDGEPMKQDDGSPVELDQGLIDRVAAAAHKAGVPAGAFDALVQEVVRNDMEQLAGKQAEELAEARRIADGWGADREENLAAMDNAGKVLGLTRQDMISLRGALGPEKAMGMLVKIGQGTREDTMIEGDRRQFGIGGAKAQGELDRLKRDPDFSRKAMISGTPEEQRWNRLQAAAGEYANRQAASGR